jgi:hypothetical protein
VSGEKARSGGLLFFGELHALPRENVVTAVTSASIVVATLLVVVRLRRRG